MKRVDLEAVDRECMPQGGEHLIEAGATHSLERQSGAITPFDLRILIENVFQTIANQSEIPQVAREEYARQLIRALVLHPDGNIGGQVCGR